MPFRVSPGVSWTETDLTSIVPGTATSVGSIAGRYQWGPVEEITTITSENQMVGVFGEPNNDTYESFFGAASFLSYSDHLKVVRVVGEDARNATSGGDGVDFEANLTVANGQVMSASVTNAGTGFVSGDLIMFESNVTPAVIKVVSVGDQGSVDEYTMLSGGRGHTSSGVRPGKTMVDTLVKNDADMDGAAFVPEVIARYPGSMGNTLVFTAVRASEFENWAYRSRFGVAPDADVFAFDGDGSRVSFELPEGMTELASDAVVTVGGYERFEGVDPGEYTVMSGAIEFVEDVETFSAPGDSEKFTLVNASGMDSSEARVQVDGISATRYTGDMDVPYGQYKVNGNYVMFGVMSDKISGDGAAVEFTVQDVTGMTDAVVEMDGRVLTVVTTGSPAANEVLVADSGSDTTLTFGTPPKMGVDNVRVRWGFPAAGANVEVTYGAPREGENQVKVFSNQTEIHAAVVDVDGVWAEEPYGLLERYEFLSTSPGTKNYDGSTKYYVDAINRRSSFVRLGSELSSWGGKRLTGGNDANGENDVTPGILQSGFEMFRNGEEVDFSHLVVGAVDAATMQYIIGNVVEFRRDCVAYFTAPLSTVLNNKGKEAESIVKFRNQLSSTSYAHGDSGWKQVYDRYNDVTRWVPCAADSAGSYSWTHDNVDPWYSAAGLNRGRVRNAIKLAWVPNETERDILYANGINPIVWYRGEGAVLWGDKTLQSKPSAFDRMNVRWLFIVLEKSIAQAARYYLFEFNDESTRGHFRNTVQPFLRDVQGRRGISDFKVICDETNNTGTVVDRNEFVADILIKPARSVNFIQLNFVAVGTDVSFEEALQQG